MSIGKRRTVLISAFVISAGWVTVGLGADRTSQTLLRGGFVLRGVDGKLTRQDSNGVSDRWFFEFDSAIGDGRRHVDGGTSLQLLPSSTLERMVVDANDRSEPAYKLWARVTKYKGSNFVFPIYFLPLSKSEQSPPSATTSQEPEREGGPTVDDPNDKLTIPKEIMDRLKARPAVRREQPGKQNAQREARKRTQPDFILANRAGFVREAERRILGTEREFDFVFDALGRNVQQTSLRLLPCEVLEQTEQRQAAEPDSIRFKVAGIVTDYKGERFLLLQRAIRVYSYGNFSR